MEYSSAPHVLKKMAATLKKKTHKSDMFEESVLDLSKAFMSHSESYMHSFSF